MGTQIETPGFKELDPALDYVDATEFQKMILEKMSSMEELVGVMARSLKAQGDTILDLRRKTIELEADMAQAGIGTSVKKSAIILPSSRDLKKVSN